MSLSVDSCAQDLLEKEERGELSHQERARLGAHLGACPACALQRQLVRDFAEERGRVRMDDGAILARSVAGALAITRGSPVSGTIRRSKPRRGVLARGVAAGLAVSLLAVATVWSARHVLGRRGEVTASPVAVAVVETTDSTDKGLGVHDVHVPAPAPNDAKLVDDADTPGDAEVGASAHGPKRLRVGASPTAKGLLAAAKRAEARGDVARAVRLYRELEAHFSGTREEIASRVWLGRILVDRLGDPAGALALFDSYLAADPAGDLEITANLGRALSLMQLGRFRDERQVWQLLLARSPDAALAQEARAHLQTAP